MAIVKSADRVVLILEAVAKSREGMTHGEISRNLRIPGGSLSSLLSNLVDRGYLSFEPMGKLFMLGPEILVLTGRYLDSLDIIRLGRPVIDALVQEINEDVEIAVRRGDEVLFLLKVESQRPVKYSIAPGELAPLYATSPGKCILAFTPDEEVSAYLDRVTLLPTTNTTITGRDVFMGELELIRVAGLAYGREEYQHGICGIAAPVFNIHGAIVGSVVVTLQAERFDPGHKAFIEPKLRQAAAGLSRRLGFAGMSHSRETGSAMSGGRH